MRTEFKDQTIARFLDSLGSCSPAPGGGSAAALTAATGTALVEMVSGINLRRTALKTKGAKSLTRSEVFKRTSAIRKVRGRLLELVTEDAESFSAAVRFYGDPKKKSRYQKALKDCAGVPFEVCRLVVLSLKAGCAEKTRTSRWLMSDLLEASILLKASFQSARLNVEINLNQVQAARFRRLVARRLDAMEKETVSLSHRLWNAQP